VWFPPRAPLDAGFHQHALNTPWKPCGSTVCSEAGGLPFVDSSAAIPCIPGAMIPCHDAARSTLLCVGASERFPHGANKLRIAQNVQPGQRQGGGCGDHRALPALGDGRIRKRP